MLFRSVRSRGPPGQLPRDLVVEVEGQYARLRHGPVKGRTNRHGFVCAFDEVTGCTSRRLRRRLEAEPKRVHLCAAAPCTEPAQDMVHAPRSAVVARDEEVDLLELAGRGPLCRLARVAGHVWHRCTRRPETAGPCPRRGRVRRSTDLDPNSETDTDADEKPCQAALVALDLDTGVRPLSAYPCPDVAQGSPIPLLLNDADRSAQTELGGRRPVYTFQACPQHRNAYAAARAPRACAHTGCPRPRTSTRRDRKSTRLNSSHSQQSRMPSSA